MQEETQILLQEVHLLSQEKIITLSHRKNISYDEGKWKILPVTENICSVMHSVLLLIGRTFPVTRKTSCDRKNNSCDKRRSMKCVTGGFFPVKVKNISCVRKFISCDTNKKQHLVQQYIFPVNEGIFLPRKNKEHLMSHEGRLNRLYSCPRNSDILDIFQHIW